MIFRKISYQIAAQFMAFVFLLSMVIGGTFLAVDMHNARRGTTIHLQQILRGILLNAKRPADIPASLTPLSRERIRIVDADGTILFSGALYEHIPFVPEAGVRMTMVDEESYAILTAPFLQDDKIVGYLQVADRTPFDDVANRIFLFLVISGGLSALTFGVGIFFARRSLKPAEQMVERLEQFTQDASHELRTPLTAVSTSLDLALATNDYRENIVTAKKDLKEVFSLVERLLELARLDRFLLQKEHINFSSLILESAEKSAPAAGEKGIKIDCSIAPDIFVQGDPTLLRQVVSNLLTNAIKFNAPKGKITVTLTQQLLTIQDTGKGISEEALPRIFDRFFQEGLSRTKGKEGLGLGLALVKRIVELHGWTITAQSTPGKGAVFSIRFSSAGRAKKL